MCDQEKIDDLQSTIYDWGSYYLRFKLLQM